MMVGFGVVLLVWGIVLFIIGAAIVAGGVLYYRKGKEYHDMKKALLIEAERRVKLQYNKIAMLPVKDLNTYLAGIFSRYIELDGEFNTIRDNQVQEKLFTDVQADVLKFLGDETVHAIEYYYGDRYIEKWTGLAYLILEKRRKLGGFVNGSTERGTYESIESLLTQELNGTRNAPGP